MTVINWVSHERPYWKPCLVLRDDCISTKMATNLLANNVFHGPCDKRPVILRVSGMTVFKDDSDVFILPGRG